MAYLEVLNGPEVGQKAPISQEVFFIGRDANNHLVLSDRTVSRKHAVINQLEGQFVITDLKSLKGILVNGVKTNEANLEDEDEIAIGAVRIRFYTGTKGKRFSLGPSKKLKSPWIVIGVSSILFAAFALLYSLEKIPFFSLPKTASNLNQIENHYQRGVELLNRDRDIEGAKREWQQVLGLDPHRKTIFGQKAAKLLENISD